MKILYDTYPEYTSLFNQIFEKIPLLSKLKKTPQNPRWHQEGCVETHTKMVIEEIIPIVEGLPEEERLILILSALLHDVGKVIVTEEVEGKITSKGHELAGAKYLKPLISLMPLSDEVKKQLLGIVGYHDMPRILINTDANPKEYDELRERVDLNLLYLFEIADVKGRICADLDVQLEIIEKFKRRFHELGL